MVDPGVTQGSDLQYGEVGTWSSVPQNSVLKYSVVMYL